MFNTPVEVNATMGKTNTGSQTGKKHNCPQNQIQYSSSRTGIGGRKKKINPYQCQLVKERTNQENNHSIV